MWIKRGIIISKTLENEWSQTHIQVPVAHKLEKCIRVFYATRDKNNRSHTSYIDLDIDNLENVIYRHHSYIIPFGRPGSFDDSGIMPTSVLEFDGTTFLYYIGWTQKVTVPFHNSIGIASQKDDGSFSKIYNGPILTSIKEEPYFCGTACVLKEDNHFKMWYLSCIGWIKGSKGMEPLYNIKYSESNDGLNWSQTGRIAIDLEDDEGGLASATVYKLDGVYLMWFSVRKQLDYRNNHLNGYRIRMAYSKDGVNWKRNEDNLLNLDVSIDGWDSEMVAYPNIIELKDKLVLFYNGNGFGKSGFGYAELKKTELQDYIKNSLK